MPAPEFTPDEEEIFQYAAALPPAERQEYLGRACTGYPELRAAVDRLLAAVEDDAFMLRPSDRTVSPEMEAEFARLKPEEAGDRIGNYKLLEQIGEGGFGVVWVAEQEKPVRRRVALKVIKLGMDTREVIARFEQERQALALMDHPNIAKVFDAGATQFGRPYFVMELVKGVRITDYCDQASLSTAERLMLFTSVCSAVQHAHQKGIIHRDLKPSNILVTLHDGVAVPKVIDFGVAKATQQQRLTDLTIYTQFEQMIGTPLYMAPEQAELSGLDIDTRSDIYSLGVLLYELLTGRTPFDPEMLLKAGYDEMRRVIREEEPQKPSTVISTMALELRTTVAKHRSAEGAKLINAIRGDLDWIVLKALEKDRNRRYESASGFARDIERHLQNEPVQARPATVGYRFRRFARRNKLAFASGLAVLVSLAVGLSVSTWMFVQEKRARERAVAAEKLQDVERQNAQNEAQRAEQQARKSEEIAGFLTEMLDGVAPQVALGRDTTMLRAILDKSAARISTELRDQPEIRAAIQCIIGDVYSSLGEFTKAIDLQNEALAIRRKHLGEQHPETADSLTRIGVILNEQAHVPEAEEKLRAALAIHEKIGTRDTAGAAGTMNALAQTLRYRSMLAEAESLARKSLAIRRQLLGEDHRDVAASLGMLGQVLAWAGKRDPEFERLLDASQDKNFQEDSAEMAGIRLGQAQDLRGRGKFAESEAANREALKIMRKIFGNNHPNVADCVFNLACVLTRQRKTAEAEAAFQEALAIHRKNPDGPDPEGSHIKHEMAHQFEKNQEYGKAEALLRESIVSEQKKGDPADHRLLGTLGCLASVLTDWAWSERLQPGIPHERALEAEEIARATLAIRLSGPEAMTWKADQARSRLGGAVLCVAATKRNLSEAARTTKFREAEELLLSTLDRLQSDPDVGNPEYRRDPLIRLVRLYEAWGDAAKAAAWQQKLVEFDRAREAARAQAAAAPQQTK